MERLELGVVELEPADKNHKVYTDSQPDSEPFKSNCRGCPPGSSCAGYENCTHWVLNETTHSKSCFQHLSQEQ